MFVLALLSPFMLALTLLLPPYAGMVGASYIIYHDAPAKSKLIAQNYDNVPYMIDVYTKLFNRWSGHMAETSLWGYSVPLIVLPLVGAFIGIVLTSKFSRKLQNIFHLNT